MANEQLVKVRFLGSADPRETNGLIMLADGENGEPRSLTLGGDPNDAHVTVEELHMLTGRYQIEVVEDDEASSASATTSEPAFPPAPEGSGASSAPPSTPASSPEPASPTASSAA